MLRSTQKDAGIETRRMLVSHPEDAGIEYGSQKKEKIGKLMQRKFYDKQRKINLAKCSMPMQLENSQLAFKPIRRDSSGIYLCLLLISFGKSLEWVKFSGKTKKGGVIIPDENITW
jgi:hypothetical protein